MEFFLDSCILIGHCKHGTPLLSHTVDKMCYDFLNQHKSSKYILNISTMFTTDFNTSYRRFRREGESEEALTIFKACVETVKREYNIFERDYSTHAKFIGDYRYIVEGIENIIRNKVDATILTDAICWCLDEERLSPSFVTSDGRDIVNNKVAILNEASAVLGKEVTEVPLEIDFVSKFLS